jgi:hypothetical protein
MTNYNTKDEGEKGFPIHLRLPYTKNFIDRSGFYYLFAAAVASFSQVAGGIPFS